ncbi:MAG: hypothetical protein HY736_06395 [Verrucomicrobia bacterium]|nr:hypothetical protein [Verrucomicrobiota bacterium]
MQQFDLLTARDRLGNVGLLIQDTPGIDFPQAFRMFVPAMAQVIEGEIAGRREEKRTHVPDRCDGMGAQRPQNTLLHQIVAVAERRKPRPEPPAQVRLVRLHFVGEPTGLP